MLGKWQFLSSDGSALFISLIYIRNLRSHKISKQQQWLTKHSIKFSCINVYFFVAGAMYLWLAHNPGHEFINMAISVQAYLKRQQILLNVIQFLLEIAKASWNSKILLNCSPTYVKILTNFGSNLAYISRISLLTTRILNVYSTCLQLPKRKLLLPYYFLENTDACITCITHSWQKVWGKRYLILTTVCKTWFRADFRDGKFYTKMYTSTKLLGLTRFGLEGSYMQL